MSDFEKKLAKDLNQGKEYRDAYSEAFSNEYLATQIQMLRKQRGWTQAELGERIGSNQGRVSIYEDEDYGKWSLDTLRKMASVFGLWVKISFESYGGLIHEATHFQAPRLLRSTFEEDREVHRWLELDEPVSREEQTRRGAARWAAAERPDRAELAAWLQGDLPEFNSRETTPVQQLLESIPESEEGIWTAVARELAGLMTAERSETGPLVRNTAIYRASLFGLAKAIGPRLVIQEGLHAVYGRASERYEQEGSSGLGYEGETGLVDAMIHNQLDDRWKGIWERYLTGGEHPEDFAGRSHPFLPGKTMTGIRGLLGLPKSEDYWKEVARGVRDLERRFLGTGHARLESSPNVMDELVKAIGQVFDWWGDPSAAQELMRGAIDLMRDGSWFMFAQAAWACNVSRSGWSDAVQTGEEIESKTFAMVIANGLKVYTDWQLARNDHRKEVTRLQEDSEKASRAVFKEAA
ncbi:hypothetical protein SBA4_2290002 [Candidatus Sulfopaludibacter sp. SbA4]|nr:hypothetical protein SBA4_2290002 [Candidatus Sulfopaludibacter sp. SbA4]